MTDTTRERAHAFPQRIGLLTGGGDAPGLNAVIRAVVKSAEQDGCVCIGLENSFDGLISEGRARVLTRDDVVGIERIGGTILGTSNRGDPFAYPIEGGVASRTIPQRVRRRLANWRWMRWLWWAVMAP